MEKPNSLFRASALARIRSPEQLDTLLPITSPMSWVALLAVGIIIASALVWGFFGTILRTTNGEGIIVRNSDFGIMEVSGVGTGSILEIQVKPGDVVQRGDVIAKLDLTLQDEQLASGRKALNSLKKQSAEQEKEEAERLRILEEKMANQTSLFERGLITKTPLLETRGAIYEINSRKFGRVQQILEHELKAREMELRIGQESVIRAAHAGRVTETLVDVGDYVQAGRTIIRLESLEGEYEAIVFARAEDGKKVSPGMTIRLAPSTVRPEEYGYIQARVVEVSPYPVTRENLQHTLRNENLAARLTQNGAAIELGAVLELDPKTVSGFKWSSSHGPPIRIESGTLCSASVVLERQRPITLLVPFLKKQLGLY
jgi:HlyD family secretion protein